MNKLEFDGRLLEGIDVQRKIHDIIYETDYSGNERELYFDSIPYKYHFYKRKIYSQKHNN